ncbi:MAG: 50S ribosomal protein L9 [Phycisphaerales bacterium]
MKRSVELLLLESVENLGIVGDVVRVKAGYARNYLLPMQLAEFPSAEKIESLKEERAAAAAEQLRVRSARESLLARLEGITVTLVRSCNDRGILYGSVTQRDISDALREAGYDVDTRSVRLANAIRRVGEYSTPIQFEKDLRVEISITVEPDQPLEEREEMEIDDEGNLVEKAAPAAAPADAPAEAPATADA